MLIALSTASRSPGTDASTGTSLRPAGLLSAARRGTFAAISVTGGCVAVIIVVVPAIRHLFVTGLVEYHAENALVTDGVDGTFDQVVRGRLCAHDENGRVDHRGEQIGVGQQDDRRGVDDHPVESLFRFLD